MIASPASTYHHGTGHSISVPSSRSLSGSR